MGLEESKLLETWPPVANYQIEHLIGWQRRDLCCLFEDFRMLPQMTVSLGEFMKLLKLPSRDLAESAFEVLEPKNGRVPWLAIIGPMVLLSSQHFISRASMMFSMIDFNSSGTISRAEFFIGFRALLKGCAVFWQGFTLPSQAEVERMSQNMFAKVDQDVSELITIGEFLTFAYRSRALRLFMSAYPASKVEVYEEQIHFAGRGTQLQSAAQRSAKQLEKKSRHQIRLTPDPADEADLKRWANRASKEQSDARKKPWRQPARVSQSHAWLVWRVYRLLAKGERMIQISDLLQVVNDDLRAAAVVEEAIRVPTDEDGAVVNMTVPEGVRRVSHHFCLQLAGGHVRTRTEALRDDGCCRGLSLRAFMCVLWPHVSESDVETCMSWCKAYQAYDTLQELIKAARHEDFDLDTHDLDEMFDALDSNHDGNIDMEELGALGNLDMSSARSLSRKLDADHNGQLSKAEVRAVVQHLDTAFKEQLKGLYSCSHMPAEGATDSVVI